MKLSYQQLEPHLTKNLAPIYVICSDEFLLVQEAIDMLRNAANKVGFTERVSLSAEPNTDWGKILYANANNFSLLATKRILELHLTSTKVNAAHSQLLQEYATHPPENTLLIIHSGKLDSKIEKTAWFQALEKKGVVIQIWPITAEQLPQWIKQRAQKFGLIGMTKDAADLLAAHVEGNLLAAAQEIEKLSLLQSTAAIDKETIENFLADNARFDIFHLVESALLGNNKRCLRILDHLKAEDTEPPIVLWALTRELRMLADMAKQTKQGVALASLFSQFRIWEKRQSGVRHFLQRHSQENCWDFLSQAAKIDRIIKGSDAGNIWDELQILTLGVCYNNK